MHPVVELRALPHFGPQLEEGPPLLHFHQVWQEEKGQRLAGGRSVAGGGPLEAEAHLLPKDTKLGRRLKFGCVERQCLAGGFGGGRSMLNLSDGQTIHHFLHENGRFFRRSLLRRPST